MNLLGISIEGPKVCVSSVRNRILEIVDALMNNEAGLDLVLTTAELDKYIDDSFALLHQLFGYQIL